MTRVISCAALVLALLVPSLAAHAAEGAAPPGIVVKDAWLRATPDGAKVAGGYVTIANTGASADRLTAASLPGSSAGEIHTMSMENGVMHMARLDHGLVIAPGAVVTLQPGGNHLMFMNPARPLREGDRLAGALTFEKAGTVPVTFAVGGMAAKTAPAAAASGPPMEHPH